MASPLVFSRCRLLGNVASPSFFSPSTLTDTHQPGKMSFEAQSIGKKTKRNREHWRTRRWFAGKGNDPSGGVWSAGTRQNENRRASAGEKTNGAQRSGGTSPVSGAGSFPPRTSRRTSVAGRRRGEASAGPSGRRIRRARPVVRRTPPGRPAATRPMGNERKSNGGSSDETASRNGGTFSAALPRRAATCRRLENSHQPSSGFFSTRE